MRVSLDHTENSCFGIDVFELKYSLVPKTDILLRIYQNLILIFDFSFHLQQLQCESKLQLLYNMGVCPLDPEVRVIKHKNKELKAILNQQLQDISLYGFINPISQAVSRMESRYMFNDGILEDIDKIHSFSLIAGIRREESLMGQKMEEEIKNSCLILDNETELLDDGEKLANSFHNNLKENQSLVVQINIIYSRDINRSEYSQSLQLFLKWAQMFQQHSYGGFMKPLYRQFCRYLYGINKQDFSTIVDQICVFVQYLVASVTEIYGLKSLATAQHGKLIKNENVYNLIMSFIFKRTKIKKFVLSCIESNERRKRQLFGRQLERYRMKPAAFFGISKKFTLQQTSMTESQINTSIEIQEHIQPYCQSLKLVDQLCKNGSPITKLKTIVAISKQIVRDIRQYYGNLQREAPELDPDNLSSIVIYLLMKNGDKSIYEQLKVVESFTTTNCMNCISGYYLNCFSAAIESILQLQD